MSDVKIVARDGKEFFVSKEAAEKSGLIRDALDLEDDEPGKVVDIPKVDGEAMAKVVEFLKHSVTEPMNDIPKPLQGNSLEEIVEQTWYLDFITGMEEALVFKVLSAANFMHIDKLIDLVCLWCTFQIQGRSAEEIRQFLKIPKMTPEEEAQARKDHAWIFEDVP
jgi:hypothetical protein